MKVFLALLLAALHVFWISAFAPRTTFQAARVIPGNVCAFKNRRTNIVLKMSEPEKATADEPQKLVAPTSGTYYDDEVSSWGMVGNTSLWEHLVWKKQNEFAYMRSVSWEAHVLFNPSLDDLQVEPAQKEGISESMKQRLLREATTGLDSDQKQTNVILYIIAAIALLVILGGQGIFY